MNHNSLLAATFLTLAFAKSASGERIVCDNGQEKVATFTRLTEKEASAFQSTPFQAIYRVELDASISSEYLGPVLLEDQRLVTFDKRLSDRKTAVINDWDGNSGIDLSLPLKAVKSPDEVLASEVLEAQLVVIYSDHVEDEVKNSLNCRVEL